MAVISGSSTPKGDRGIELAAGADHCFELMQILGKDRAVRDLILQLRFQHRRIPIEILGELVDFVGDRYHIALPAGLPEFLDEGILKCYPHEFSNGIFTVGVWTIFGVSSI